MSTVAITIINYRNKNDTVSCLESLARVKREHFKMTIVVVNNAPSSRFSKEDFTMPKDTELVVIDSNENIGFTGGHNRAIKLALERQIDYSLILNNDTIVDEELVEALLKTFDEKRNLGAVSPKIYFAKGYEFYKDRYKKEELGKVLWYAGGKIDMQNVIGSNRGVDEVDHGQFDECQETDSVTGCCMLIKSSVFAKMGFFDERYFLYYEDADLSLRLRKHGFSIYYNPNAVVWHKNAASSSSGSSLHDYYITRNRLLFGSKYASLRSKVALFRESLSIITSGRPWQRKGVLDFFLQRFGKGSFVS